MVACNGCYSLACLLLICSLNNVQLPLHNRYTIKQFFPSIYPVPVDLSRHTPNVITRTILASIVYQSIGARLLWHKHLHFAFAPTNLLPTSPPISTPNPSTRTENHLSSILPRYWCSLRTKKVLFLSWQTLDKPFTLFDSLIFHLWLDGENA